MGTLHRKQVASDISNRLGVSEARGQEALDAVLDSIQESLIEGDTVAILGFGRFDVAEVAARRVNSIRRTQGVIEVPAHRKVRFKPGAVLNAAADNQWYERLFNKAKRYLTQ
jgi:DNA-binding protein HU-beta